MCPNAVTDTFGFDQTEAQLGAFTRGQGLPRTFAVDELVAKGTFSAERHATPDEFDEYRTHRQALGIPTVFSGPLVRSSYHAAEVAAGV